MNKLLSFALLSLLAVSGCTHDTESSGHSRATSADAHHPVREFNPVTGDNERRPPFGPRSNKALD